MIKESRSRPSPGLRFNHSTLVQLMKAQDSYKLWSGIRRDENNFHLHRRASFKIRWLSRKMDILRRCV